MTRFELDDRAFQAFASRWKLETSHLSSLTAIVAHDAYRAIIAMGPSALPLILRELEHEDPPHFWFPALTEITGEDPVPEAAMGNVIAMREAWLAWAWQRAAAG